MFSLHWKARPVEFDKEYGPGRIQMAVYNLLKEKQFSRSGMFPLEVAKRIGCTRNEARLALSYWTVSDYIGQRRDGRFYYKSDEPWKAR